MNLAALLVSIGALGISALASLRQLALAQKANSLPALVDLFTEHRGEALAEARHYVFTDMTKLDLSDGLASLPEDKRRLVRDLAWFYDNLGALVAHGVVPVEPISGYLGGSVVNVWEALRPLVEVERAKRASMLDPLRWQQYFENLYLLVLETKPQEARNSAPRWLLGTSNAPELQGGRPPD
jgi:hypothetical protein